MSPSRLVVLGLLVGACTPKASEKKVFRVLTYSSMTGEKSLGAAIEEDFEKTCLAAGHSFACDLVLVPEEGDSSLVSTYLKSPEKFDAILGLEALQVAQLRSKIPLASSSLFAKGPHAFIVDTQQWRDSSKWPKSWKDLSQFSKSVFVQDPRVSSVGIGWIKAIFVERLLTLAVARQVTKKTFPSWSVSYSAFQKGGAPLVWSYQSSEAYHRCEEKSERYQALPLLEGYPTQEEYIVIPQRSFSKESEILISSVLSQKVQTQIPLKNWMWPALETTPLPECFKAVTPIKALTDLDTSQSAVQLRDWIDQWSL